jgi:hypothetical protein
MMRLFREIALATSAIISLEQAAVADIFTFNVNGPEAGWIGVVQGEPRLINGPIKSNQEAFRIWTADRKVGAVTIWCAPTTAERRRMYLRWNDTGDLPMLELRPTAALDEWQWHPTEDCGDTVYAHLQVASGKHKGRFVGRAEVPVESNSASGKSYRLRLVDKPEQALRFAVYVVAP